MSNVLMGSVVNPAVVRGKSAYEIAVMHGFDGTEEEWLYFLAEQANKIAMVYAEEAAKSEANASAFNISARKHDENAGAAASRAETAETGAKGAEASATLFANNALASQNAAKASETNAKTSETNAKKSEENAKASEDNAKASEKIAVESAESAAESAKSAHDAGYTAAAEAISDLKISWDEEKTSAIAAIEASKQAMIEEVESEIAEEKESLLEDIEIAAEIVQTAGDSETAVMSQKATTYELDKIRDSYCETEIDVGEMTDGYYATGFGDISVASDSSASGFIDLTNRHSNLIKFENLFARGSRACTLFNVNRERTRYILASSTDTEATITLTEDEVYAQLTSFVGQKPVIRVLNIIEAVSHKTVYVDGQDGNDSNNGTKTQPYRTIQKAVDSGAKTIFIIPMDYTETVTLTYKDGVSLFAWDYADFTNEKPTKRMVHITGGTDKSIANGLVINKSSNIYVEDIWCDNTSSYPFNITNSNNINMNRCHASNSPAHGFCLVNVNGVFRDCMAWNIGDESVVHADGFNIHGYGNTEFINCVAHDCVDDGISHHDGCTGLIQGGEYYNCGKGGVASPTHGAQVNVYGVFSHDNAFGIYTALEDGKTQKDSIIANNLLYNNTSAGIYANGYTLKAFGNVLRGNTNATRKENGGMLFLYESNQ